MKLECDLERLFVLKNMDLYPTNVIRLYPIDVCVSDRWSVGHRKAVVGVRPHYLVRCTLNLRRPQPSTRSQETEAQHIRRLKTHRELIGLTGRQNIADIL